MMEFFEKILNDKKSSTIFEKRSIVDPLRNPEYASEILDSLKAVILRNSSRSTT